MPFYIAQYIRSFNTPIYNQQQSVPSLPQQAVSKTYSPTQNNPIPSVTGGSGQSSNQNQNSIPIPTPSQTSNSNVSSNTGSNKSVKSVKPNTDNCFTCIRKDIRDITVVDENGNVIPLPW